MKKPLSGHQLGRRQFLRNVFPASALTCMGCSRIFATSFGKEGFPSQEIHPFQEELTRKWTYQQLFEYRYKTDFIPILKAIKEDIGAERTLEILRNASSKNNAELGRRVAARVPSNDMKTFAAPFRNPNSMLNKTNIIEIIEDTDTAFEMKITECLTEKVFREENALDIGHAAVCFADFALPQAFNPKIKLVRDKTLMQGHGYCNHRYILTE